MNIRRRKRQELASLAIALAGFGLVACGDDDNPTAAPPINPNPPVAATVAEIQGTGHISPLVGQKVEVEGIVTAIRLDGGAGFYLQSSEPDTNPATSEGIFVFTDITPNVAIGDSVTVMGDVSEFRQGGDNSADLSLTQISNPMFEVQSSQNETPVPVIIGAGGSAIPNAFVHVDGDLEADDRTLDPDNSSIDFFESLEDMLVQVSDSIAVGPTDPFNQIFVMTEADRDAATQTTNGGVLISANNFNPNRIELDGGIDETFVPEVNVGASLDDAIGVVGYSFSNYEVILTEAVTALNATPVAETTDLTREDNQLTIATYNVLNLDPSDDTFAALAAHIVTNLGAPDIVALQEVQDNSGSADNGVVAADATFQTLVEAIAAVNGPTYLVRQLDPEDGQDGGQPGGNIRVAFLFNPARVSFDDREGGDDGTPVSVISNNGAPQLAINPGLIEPETFPDSRKPLAAEFQFNGQTVFAIANHFNSKSGDDPLFGRVQPPMLNTQPERITQAEAVNEFVDEILALDADANVIVLGDLNDFEFSPPLDRLAGNVLTNTINAVAERDRYTFIFQGNSQVLDHILVSNNLAPGAIADIVHVNVDTAATVSDREPVVARIAIPGS
ncbi:MAG: endonuclease/exonuclease/phosphatase family protein [Cyanobacteria bacterium P01_E01_bin.48]